MALAMLLLFVAAVAAWAPASLLDARLSLWTQGRLRLSAPSGTVWCGKGSITNARGDWSVPVAWRIDPTSLLRGNRMLTIHSPDNGGAAGGNVGWQDETVILDQFALAVPAMALADVIGARGMPALGGVIVLDAPSFRWDGARGAGSLKVRWQNARLASPAGSVDLGTVTLALAPRGSELAAHIENAGGDLRISGETSVVGADARLSATLSAAPSAAPNVVRALAALGVPDASGAVRVQWQGALR